MTFLDRRRFLACLSEPSRFQLVTTLSSGPRCVTELAGLVGLSQSCTTRHLQALLRESIVVAERRGKRVVYALRHEGRTAHPVLQWACDAGAYGGDVAVEGSAARRGRRASAAAMEPRRSGRVPELEADPISATIAVEHEGGWVAADAGSSETEPSTDSPGESADDPPADTSPNATSRRAEMDDFLL